MLTEDEVKWIGIVLNDRELFEVSPSYYYQKKIEIERNEKKEMVRIELDGLRKEMIEVTPEDLITLKSKSQRENLRKDNFPGIYIIQNSTQGIYYVGQAEKVFDRAYKHFILNSGNADVYNDYILDDKFSISLIPLESTSFSTLNELEDNAIRAYDSYHSGYNKMPGNVLDVPIFKNDNYQKAAYLILDRIRETEEFSSLTTKRKRIGYVNKFLSEYGLPSNANFILGFAKVIQEYQKANKLSKK